MAAARHFTDLACWQLANELKVALYDISGRPRVQRDGRLRIQLRDAAASGPANIAEGFARRTHKDFAHFLDVARASLTECQQHVLDCFDRDHITMAECRELTGLAKRACGATAALQRYLRNHPDPD